MKKKRGKQQENTLFALLLSSLLSKSDTNKPLIRKCLNKISHSLPHSLSDPIISLLPALLNSNCCQIVCKTAEIIGTASLVSIEMNENISNEDGIVKGLISLVGSSKSEIAMTSCNAILDLSTTSVGQRRLLELSAIDNIIHCFVQASKSSAAADSATGDMLLLNEDEYIISLVQGAVALINSCTVEMLRSIRNELSDAFVAYLKRLWVQAHKQSLYSSSLECGQNKDSYPSRIGKRNLAESIFKLSMNQCLYLEPTAVDWFINDFGEISNENFLSTIWELSPMLIRDASKSSRKQNDIFAPFVRYLGPEELISTSLPSILKSFVSCPPIASDELDILRVINDVKNCLGSPIIYQQDIRVIKTNCSGKETHYFQEKSYFDCCTDAHNLHINEISKCEDAVRNGYSIALRGLEFRFQTLAAIADGLASFFGQPSVGINMYLTPPNSQGLARHSDDHCVFVCQLFGVKRWNIFPRETSQLPRLYETFDESCGLEAEFEAGDKCQKILLKQGDILYIPRGFPHEAHTDLNDDESNETTRFSLHLTLAVEIEPPFEWEGFMHVALYSWAEKQKTLPYTSNKFRSLHMVSVKLLHVAIKLLGNFDSTFRKACLVSSTSMMSLIPENWFSDNQKTIFNYLISRIATESKLSDAIQHVEAAIQKNEDPLEHVIWLKHLKGEGETKRSNDLGISSSDNRYMLDLLVHQDIAKASFMEVKSKFCREVEFEGAEQHYRVLLDKYRKVRKQYTKGMLSLHCTVGNEHEIASL